MEKIKSDFIEDLKASKIAKSLINKQFQAAEKSLLNAAQEQKPKLKIAKSTINKKFQAGEKTVNGIASMIKIIEDKEKPSFNSNQAQQDATKFYDDTYTKYAGYVTELDNGIQNGQAAEKAYREYPTHQQTFTNIYNDKNLEGNKFTIPDTLKAKLKTFEPFKSTVQNGGSSSSQSTRPAPLFYN